MRDPRSPTLISRLEAVRRQLRARTEIIASRKRCIDSRAAFDKLRLRGIVDGRKVGPHAELVEARTAVVHALKGQFKRFT